MASQKANKNVADALVIAAGSGFCRDVSRLPLGDSGRVICADGGVEACRALGLSPHILTGDLDSASDSLIEWVRDCGACVRRYYRQDRPTWSWLSTRRSPWARGLLP